jgi:purine nucleosidase
MALVKAPDIAEKIAELVIMGGACFELGNVTPAAEFNIHVDPHAAAIVLDSGVPITMIPLDVTHQLLNTPPRLALLRGLGNRGGPAVAALLTVFDENRHARFGTRAEALHDPAVVAFLLHPAV